MCALQCECWIVLKIWIICNQGLHSSYQSPQHMAKAAESSKCQLEM